MRSRTSSTTSAIDRLRQFAADVRVIVEEVIQKSPVTDILIAVKGVVSSCDTDETSADFSRSLSSTARTRASALSAPLAVHGNRKLVRDSDNQLAIF